MNISDELRELVADVLGMQPANIQEVSRFWEDLNADSLDQVELVIAAEEKWNIEIPDEEADKLKTFGEAVKYLESRVETKEAP